MQYLFRCRVQYIFFASMMGNFFQRLSKTNINQSLSLSHVFKQMFNRTLDN